MSSEKSIVLITGASKGIGQALVSTFQSHDWLVAACARHDYAQADLSLHCDVAKVNEVRDTVSAVIKKWGRLDAVVNNAGVAGQNSLDPNHDDELWHHIIDVNLHGTYYMSKYALPYLPDESGRIVNISSVLGLKGVADQTAYCASKHAVLGFTKALALYAAPRKITVNAICPGWVKTEMAINRMKEIGLSERHLAHSVPFGRFIEPQEVADLAFYLVTSKAAKIITGQAITIDGGTLV